MTSQPSKTVCLLIVVLLMGCSLHAQTPTLQTFFQELPQRLARSGPPSPEELSSVSNQVASMTADELLKVLPAVITAVEYPDEDVQTHATFALFLVSRRQDSGALLKRYGESIGRLFNSSNTRLQGLAALTLLNLKTAPLEEALAPMLASLNRTDREAKEQVTVLGTLARLWPARRDVIDAIDRFMSRPLDSDTRLAALNAIRTSRVDDLRIRRVVAAALDDAHVSVKLASIATLERMGPAAVAEAQRTLDELTRRPDESDHVKSAAARVLQTIRR